MIDRDSSCRERGVHVRSLQSVNLAHKATILERYYRPRQYSGSYETLPGYVVHCLSLTSSFLGNRINRRFSYLRPHGEEIPDSGGCPLHANGLVTIYFKELQSFHSQDRDRNES
jgi:hypothetical protein